MIVLEDGVLHPGFPLLVWCMVAQSKGYALPNCLLAMAVGVITEVPIVYIIITSLLIPFLI